MRMAEKMAGDGNLRFNKNVFNVSICGAVISVMLWF